ncbi:hypothetical protein ACO2FD_00395 [Staphylococcus epidermidis]
MKNDYGSGTAIHPQTGELLALVSTPSYDVYPFMYGMSNEEYNKLTEDKKRTSAQQVPDYNFTRFNSKNINSNDWVK